MPRWVFLLGVGIYLITMGFLVTVAILGPTPGVTEGNLRRIREGMTMQQVEAILGGPGERSVSDFTPKGRVCRYHWTGTDVYVLVDFCQVCGSPKAEVSDVLYGIRTGAPATGVRVIELTRVTLSK